jgi:benzoylformate decarboxylase
VVNLHSAAGTGNAMGGLANAACSHSPLVLVAGQQVRETMGAEPTLTNLDAAALTRPLTVWSYEPASASDVPRAMSQASWAASRAPGGPVYLSVPYDDWGQPASDNDLLLFEREVERAATLSAPHVAELAARLDAAERPALVCGSDVDAVGANDAVRALAEQLDADVWLAPSSYRLSFPNKHGQCRGPLPAHIKGAGEALADYDVVLVAGAPVFRYHPFVPGPYMSTDVEVIHLTEHDAEAVRAPFGRSLVVGDLADSLRQLAGQVRQRPNARRDAWQQPVATTPAADGVFTPERVFALLRDTAPDDTTFVCESTSTTGSFWQQMDLRHPKQYFWPASAGLGFGLAGAVGVKMAMPERPVVAVIGDGSANYGITGLWSAAHYKVPVVFVILNNQTYGALQWYQGQLGVKDIPGLDLPGIDFVALAQGYGVNASRVATEDALTSTLRQALTGDSPYLIEVATKLTKL